MFCSTCRSVSEQKQHKHSSIIPGSNPSHLPFHLSEVHHVIDGAGLTHHVQPPQACVCVASVEGLETVAQVSLTGHLSQFTGQILGSQRTKGRKNIKTGPVLCVRAVLHYYV